MIEYDNLPFFSPLSIFHDSLFTLDFPLSILSYPHLISSCSTNVLASILGLVCPRAHCVVSPSDSDTLRTSFQPTTALLVHCTVCRRWDWVHIFPSFSFFGAHHSCRILVYKSAPACLVRGGNHSSNLGTTNYHLLLHDFRPFTSGHRARLSGATFPFPLNSRIGLLTNLLLHYSRNLVCQVIMHHELTELRAQ